MQSSKSRPTKKSPATKESRKKTKVEALCESLYDAGWEPVLSTAWYQEIVDSGLSRKNLAFASVLSEICVDEHPITLRGVMYRAVSTGWLPSTDKEHYNRTGRVMTRLRERGVVPFSWIVDNLRSTNKPSSWSGLGDFAETVRDAYRKDFWAHLPNYVHIFCEKDAIAGVIAPVTREYDVALSPIRGYVSLSFAHEIAEQWSRIDKPIFAYYVGDFDASGFDLERDVREKLERYSTSSFHWERLGVNAEDFDAFDLIPLEAKKLDKRYAKFVLEHGHECAEIDALPPTEIRRRIRESIESHIPQDEWKRLQAVEAAEKESFTKFMEQLQ